MLRPQLCARNLQCCNALPRLRPGRRRTMKPARSLRESSAPPAPQSRSGPRPPERSPVRVPDDVPDPPAGAVVETDIPARLDRLPWGRFHTLVVVALGITWILDGLEVTLAGALAGALKESPTLGLTNSEIGLAGSAYLAGAVLGALFFGWLTDRLGRKKLFFITLAVYLAATAATGAVVEFLELRAVSLPDRRRHRRRVRGDQLDDPGTDPGAHARLDRSRHQRQLLGRRGARRGRLDRAARSGRHRSGDSAGALAFLIGAALGARDLRHAPVDSREPALADDARPRARGATRSSRGSRRAFAATATRSPTATCRACACAPRTHTPLREVVAHAVRHAIAQRTLVGLTPDGRAGVLLQRDLLHLRADPDRFLRRAGRPASAGTSCRSRPAISSGRSCSAACSTRSAAGS